MPAFAWSVWVKTQNLSRDIRSPCRDLNPGPAEYEAGLLTSLPRRSVLKDYRNATCYKGNSIKLCPRKFVGKMDIRVKYCKKLITGQAFPNKRTAHCNDIGTECCASDSPYEERWFKSRQGTSCRYAFNVLTLLFCNMGRDTDIGPSYFLCIFRNKHPMNIKHLQLSLCGLIVRMYQHDWSHYVRHKAAVLNLVLAGTMVLFWYRIVLFGMFINRGSSSRHLMTVLAG
jgi:hypothetical protein